MPTSAIFRDLWWRKTSEAERYAQTNLLVTLTWKFCFTLLWGAATLDLGQTLGPQPFS
jgi:hypothetical protein